MPKLIQEIRETWTNAQTEARQFLDLFMPMGEIAHKRPHTEKTAVALAAMTGLAAVGVGCVFLGATCVINKMLGNGH